MLRYSDACVQLAMDSEGFAPYPAPDPIGLSTVGYGHKCLPGEQFAGRMTEDSAKELLSSDLDKAWEVVADNFNPDLTQGQVDALTDFCFNIGPGSPGHKDGLVWLKSGKHSTLYGLVNAGDPAASDELLKWDHAGGTVMSGLDTRRRKERALYLS